jgi:hypothetical protein
MTSSVLVPKLAAIDHHRRQTAVAVLLSVLVPALGAMGVLHRRQIAVAVRLSVLVPALGAIGFHHRRQVTIPMHPAASIVPHLAIAVRDGFHTHVQTNKCVYRSRISAFNFMRALVQAVVVLTIKTNRAHKSRPQRRPPAGLRAVKVTL